MAYEYITKYDALRYTQGRDGQSIKEIVIHHWGKDGQTFQGVINWFCKNSSCQTSAHYVVEAGRVACLVKQSDTAWHAGNWYHNTTSLGIECRPEMSAGDFATTAELVAELWKSYGKLPIIGHKDIIATSCPGRYYAELGTLKALAEKYYNGEKAPSVQISGWVKDNTGWWYKNTDGSYPKATWLKLNDQWYYFDEGGYAVTGWHLINNKWYYFNDDCQMQTGWISYKDRWYYLKPSDGDMVSDEFRLVGDTWYMFTPSGEMVQNKVLNISDDGSITVVENKDTVH